jgi:hypothetical protein
MKSSPVSIPVTLTGNDRIELEGCYVFRKGLAHKAEVAIASAVSFTDLPHLFHLSVSVPGSKTMTLSIGIPFSQAMRMDCFRNFWESALHDYDALRTEVASRIFDQQFEDLTKAPWTAEEIRAVEDLETSDELEATVKDDLLKIAAVALEKQDV